MAVKLKDTKNKSVINNVINKSIEQANKKVTKDIPLDLIDPHPLNQEIYTINDIESLMSSIERLGFFGTINVYQKPDGRYIIYAGHRRFEAMKRLGRKTIPATVEPMESEEIILKKLIESNQNTRIISPIEKANEIIMYEKTLYETGFKGEVAKELSIVFNMSYSKINKIKNISKLADSLKKYAYNLNFPYEVFNDAINFSKEQQNRLSEIIESYFATHPDMEFGKLLATQFINQVKNEAKIEKERKEREEKLKEIELIQQKERERLQHEFIKQQHEQQDKNNSQSPVEDDFTIHSASDILSSSLENNISETAEAEAEAAAAAVTEKTVEKNIPSDTAHANSTATDITKEAVAEDNLVTIQYDEVNIPIKEFYPRNESYNIDYDVLNYTTRLHDIIKQENTSISQKTKDEAKKLLKDILSYL